MNESDLPKKKSARTVVAYRDPELRYPQASPFDPDQAYPEYPFAATMVCAENRVYGAVRQVLYESGLDRSRFDTAQWNPFGDLVREGGTVLIKPNWVRHYHLRDEDIFSIITHPSVLRPLIDYAFKAVGPSGRVWVRDAPLFDTDFTVLRQVCQLDALESELCRRGVPLTVADLRPRWWCTSIGAWSSIAASSSMGPPRTSSSIWEWTASWRSWAEICTGCSARTMTGDSRSPTTACFPATGSATATELHNASRRPIWSSACQS